LNLPHPPSNKSIPARSPCPRHFFLLGRRLSNTIGALQTRQYIHPMALKTPKTLNCAASTSLASLTRRPLLPQYPNSFPYSANGAYLAVLPQRVAVRLDPSTLYSLASRVRGGLHAIRGRRDSIRNGRQSPCAHVRHSSMSRDRSARGRNAAMVLRRRASLYRHALMKWHLLRHHGCLLGVPPSCLWMRCGGLVLLRAE